LWIDHSGDEDADVGGGDAAGELHQLAHLADGDGLAFVERQLVDGPQGGALLAVESGALEFVDGVDDQPDGVDGGDGFDVGSKPDVNLKFVSAVRPNWQTHRGRGLLFRRGDKTVVAWTPRAAANKDGVLHQPSLKQKIDNLAPQQLRPSDVKN
jgi:hypothetical protein